jgi:multidrug efflux pump
MITATVPAVFFVPVFFVVVRTFFKGSKRQRELQAAQAEERRIDPDAGHVPAKEGA